MIKNSFRIAVVAALTSTAGCMSVTAVKSYRLQASGSNETTVDAVGQAFTLAGAEVVQMDPGLKVVYSKWMRPYPNDIFQRRFVGVIDPRGELVLRLDLQTCEPLEECVDANGVGFAEDQRLLSEFAAKVGQSLGRVPQVAQ